jgi:hypothetical protein
MDSPPTHTDLSPKTNKVLAVNEQGELHLWTDISSSSSSTSTSTAAPTQTRKKSKTAKKAGGSSGSSGGGPRSSDAVLKIVEEGSGKKVSILAAAFTSSPSSSSVSGEWALVVYGDPLRPTFERVAVSVEDGSLAWGGSGSGSGGACGMASGDERGEKDGERVLRRCVGGSGGGVYVDAERVLQERGVRFFCEIFLPPFFSLSSCAFLILRFSE